MQWVQRTCPLPPHVLQTTLVGVLVTIRSPVIGFTPASELPIAVAAPRTQFGQSTSPDPLHSMHQGSSRAR